MENGTFQCEFFWYAVTTRSRQEKAAASMLEALGIQQFLPTTDGTASVERPQAGQCICLSSPAISLST